MPLATLDLGELGEQIDAALQDADLEIDEDAALEGDGESVGQPVVEGEEATESPGDEEPAADAGEDFEARYKERFEAEYAERSQKDIRKLQSKLDRQIHGLREEKEDLEHSAGEAEHAVGFLLRQLREYDPEAADRFEQSRKATQAQLDRDRKLARLERQQADDTRSGWYAAAFPNGEISADDPELLEALRLGKDAERRLLKIKVREAGLVFDEATGRFTRAKVEAANKALEAKVAPKAEPKAPETPRNAQGQFVSRQVAQTRQREQERGKPVILSRTGPGEKAPATLQEASSVIHRYLKAAGAA